MDKENANPLRAYLDNVKVKDYDEVRKLIMAACHWDKTKWNNKLQARSALSVLEKLEILDIEIMQRVRADLSWSITEYINKTQNRQSIFTEKEVKVLQKHKLLTEEDLFG